MHETVRKDRRERVERRAIIGHRPEPIVAGLFGNPLVLGGCHRAVQVCQLLDDDVLPILERHGIVVFAEALDRQLADLHLFTLLRELLSQPVGCIFRRVKTQLDVLLNVLVGKLIDDGRGKHRIRRSVHHVDQTAVFDRDNDQAAKECVDRLGLGGTFGRGPLLPPDRFGFRLESTPHEREYPICEPDSSAGAGRTRGVRCRSTEVRILPHAQCIERLSGEGTAGQQLLLRLGELIIVR